LFAAVLIAVIKTKNAAAASKTISVVGVEEAKALNAGQIYICKQQIPSREEAAKQIQRAVAKIRKEAVARKQQSQADKAKSAITVIAQKTTKETAKPFVGKAAFHDGKTAYERKDIRNNWRDQPLTCVDPLDELARLAEAKATVNPAIVDPVDAEYEGIYEAMMFEKAKSTPLV